MALTSSSTRIFAHLIVIITVSTIGVSRPQENGNNWKTEFKSSVRRTRANERASYFDLELLEMLGRSFQNQNMILSPISIKVLLGTLMEGAGGETRNEIKHALRLYDDPEATRIAVRTWVSLFKSNSVAELKLATHMFLSTKNEVNKDYGRILRRHYNGDVSKIDIGRPSESAEKVNDWVSKVTNGFISRLVNEAQITDDTIAILASAVYFKSKWQKPFEGTINKCFHKTPGHCTNTVFMQKNDVLNYAYVPSIQADVIELPYKDDRYSMVIMVPKGRIRELTRDLQHGYLADILTKLTPTDIHIQLPRFTADSEQDVIPALQQLQINELFGASANLSGILSNSNGLLTISNVIHSAKIIVDEDGTEAAGATAALLVPLIAKITKPVVVDKPFVFFIRDSVTNVILFAGHIFDPEKSKTGVVNDRIHEVGDKSSNPDFINGLEQSVSNVDPVHKQQGTDKEHKPPRKPGPPEPLPMPFGKPNGFLATKPPEASINFEGPSIKNDRKNYLRPQPLQALKTTIRPLMLANPSTAPPLLEYHTTAPPLLAHYTTAPPLLSYPTTASPLSEVQTAAPLPRVTPSRRISSVPPQYHETMVPPTASTTAKGSSNKPPIISINWYGHFVHGEISIKHYQVSDAPKIRRSSDEIVFTL